MRFTLITLITLLTAAAVFGANTAGMKAGKAELKWAGSLAFAPDGKTLYVCNRFNDDVSAIDLVAKKEVCRVAVQREPVAATAPARTTPTRT